MAFKVMTWNVENLFQAGATFGPKTQAVYDEKLDGLAALIDAEAPQALGVQEIGDPNALDDLEQRLDGTWHRRVSQHEDGRGIRVAWLTPLDITDSEEIFAFAQPLQPVQSDDTGGTQPSMGRGAVAITVTSDLGQPVRLVTAHLKSKLLTFPEAGSSPTTRANEPGSPPTRCTGGPLRRPVCGRGRQPSWHPRPSLLSCVAI